MRESAASLSLVTNPPSGINFYRRKLIEVGEGACCRSESPLSLVWPSPLALDATDRRRCWWRPRERERERVAPPVRRHEKGLARAHAILRPFTRTRLERQNPDIRPKIPP